MKILTDDIEDDPILDFDRYSEAIVNMIRDSNPKFAIGVYGEWGTGKTSLMRLVQNKLKTHIKTEIISWNDILQDKSDANKLKAFLKENFDLDWIKDQRFQKDGDILTLSSEKAATIKIDHKGTYEFISQENSNSHSLSIVLNREQSISILTVDNNLVREFITKEENGKISIYLNNILTVWFNAWRYEREDQFALVALMKTIGYAMADHPIYKEVKPILLRGIGIIGKDILRNLALRSTAMTQEGLNELQSNLLPKMDILSKIDKDTVYFEGLNRIEKEMRRIMKKSTIVVFVDDLDRCSPEKTLEVFESIKVFLNIEGFVFIIGLSYDTLNKLITTRYEKVGISGLKGEQYIQKIIQIPITLQEWNLSDIDNLISDILGKGLLTDKYSRIIRQNKKLITSVVELNPRAVKRFINNFITAYEIYSSEEYIFVWDEIPRKDQDKFKEFLKQRFNLKWIDAANIETNDAEVRFDTDDHSLIIRKPYDRPKAMMILDDIVIFEFLVEYKNQKLKIYPPRVKSTDLLIVQALKERWPYFYTQLNSNLQLREDLSKNIEEFKSHYIERSEEDRIKYFEDLKTGKTTPIRDFERPFMNFSSDYKFWDFLRDHLSSILAIEDWEIYRRATESVKIPIPEPGTTLRQIALNFLLDSKVTEFNDMILRKDPSKQFEFPNIDLSGKNLSGVDLTRTNLQSANLARTNLNTAKLTGANLKGANLRESNLKASLLPYDLSDADLSYADLSDAKLLNSAVLTRANLSHASLKRIKFIDVYLREVNLSFADLTDANLICEDAPFDIIGSNLSYANLSGARLTGRYFYLEECDLSNAKLLQIYSENTIFAKSKIIAADFSNAILLNADFTAADLSNTNLAGASLVGAKFVRTRLTATDLSNTKIIECKEYSDLICDQANFDNAFIDNEKLVCYLREHGGKNVPDAVTDTKDIDKILEELKSAKDKK